uniref:T7-like DNA polymerase 3-5 exonuclease n=1 Tax=uncultured marine virus TaxID=186617 RepID=A0A0F7L8M3_9VIRU|nr:T7-like DNA polymerase 3-5 exonuclease [uncultured marine virus]
MGHEVKEQIHHHINILLTVVLHLLAPLGPVFGGTVVILFVTQAETPCLQAVPST